MAKKFYDGSLAIRYVISSTGNTHPTASIYAKDKILYNRA